MLVELTQQAQKRVKTLLEKQNDPADLSLRVYITGGGCSGFQYGFTFDAEKNEDDFLLEKDGVSMRIDPMSMQFLDGSTVDFLNDLQGSRFIVQNPNVKNTCGCGASFSV